MLMTAIVLIILGNIVAYPILMIGEAAIRFATNMPFDVKFIGNWYQDIKYGWLMELLEDDDADYGVQWFLLDVLCGFLSIFFLALLGYWLLVPIGIFGALMGSRMYFQHKGKQNESV